MNILIPMAGKGSRFLEKGYTFPKPLIDVMGKPMIQHIIESLPFLDANWIFIAQKEHVEKYNLQKILNEIVGKEVTIITVNQVTQGAACSALLAKQYINTWDELIVANSDQIISFSEINFNLFKRYATPNGIIFTFNANHPKWSYVRLNKNRNNHQNLWVNQVAEKNPISNIATCGVYYWDQGNSFIRSIETMIGRNDRVNGEFYIAPSYNYLIEEGRCILPYFVDKMIGLGTPEDLENYINAKN